MDGHSECVGAFRVQYRFYEYARAIREGRFQPTARPKIVKDHPAAAVVDAEGKVRVALNRGIQVPEGWIIDANGQPTTEPADFKGDPPGAILPLGGVVAHKGTALSLMVEILGGALSGLGCAAGSRTMVSNGVLLNVYNIDHFVDREEYCD